MERAEIRRGSVARIRIVRPPSGDGVNLLRWHRIEVSLILDAGTRRVSVMFLRIRSEADRWFEIPPPARGLYRVHSVELAIADPLRLTSLRILHHLDTEAHLRVLPRPEELRSLIDVRGHGGIDLLSYLSLERNDDLIEARPYHPGDDATRLHWNLYAHTGDLFVRLGEEVPPPRRSVVVAVDAHAAGEDRSEAGACVLDFVIEFALGIAVSLEASGFSVALALSNGEAVHSLGDTVRAAHALAALDTDGRLLESAPAVPIGERGTMVQVTSGLAESCPPDLRGRSVVVLVMDEIDGSRVQRAWNARTLD